VLWSLTSEATRVSVDKAKNGFVIYYNDGEETSIHPDLDSVLVGLKKYCDDEVSQWIENEGKGGIP